MFTFYNKWVVFCFHFIGTNFVFLREFLYNNRKTNLQIVQKELSFRERNPVFLNSREETSNCPHHIIDMNLDDYGQFVIIDI